MPIPQFHRTPKTRRRRARRTSPPLPGEPLDTEDNGALLQSSDAEDPPPPPSDELPALLSDWPPHRSK
jgi:hypothetical protein